MVAKCGKKRLLQTTDKNTERKVEYSEEETSLPCVYAMLYDEGYEYALLTGENQITYISTSFIDKENVKFSEDYLPYDFMTEEGRAFGSGYSIYYGKVLATMIDTDYTRDSNPEVRDAHTRTIGDDDFVVRVILDEQGREIIDDCAQWSYEPGTYEAEETIYDDLKGMEYKAMEADRERNMMIVTYMDEGEEKTREYLMP